MTTDETTDEHYSGEGSLPVGVREIRNYNSSYHLKDPDHDEIKDGYQLRWVGKNYARLQEGLRPETVIVPDSAHNSKPENQSSENLFLTGDNLEVLKHLEHAYTNSIDMVYIDPPYNTGSDRFVYNDNFNFSDDQLKATLGLSDIEAQRVRNLFGKSSHSAWLTFMYPRLKVAKRLLKNKGVLAVSIDDNEQANLKLLLDEVFGEGCFAGVVPWRKRTAKSDVPYGLSQDFEYVLVYAASPTYLAGAPIERKYHSTPDYPNDRWRLADLTSQRSEAERPNSAFTMVNPRNGDKFPHNRNRTWSVSVDTFDAYYQKGKIVFPGDYDFLNITVPAYRVFESEDVAKAIKKYGTEKPQKAISTQLPTDVGLSEDGNEDIVNLFGSKIFSYPKPVSLLVYLISNLTNDEAVILDFFAGSGTTGHAVMELNQQDGGERKFILANVSEPVQEQTPASNAGYATIDQISRDRLELARTSLSVESGFRHYRFVTPSEQTIERIEDFNPVQLTIIPDDMVTPFSEEALTGSGCLDGVPTLLTTWLIDDGYDFGTKPQNVDLAGYRAHHVPETARLYLIDNKDWSSESCRSLLNLIGRSEIAVNTVVLFPYSFSFTELTELKNNLRTALDVPPQVIERY